MDLDTLRREIGDIDEQLVTLFCRRMEVAGEIAAYKQANGLPVPDAARERAVLAKVAQQAGEPFGRYARVLYGTLFDVSRAYQHTKIETHAPLEEAIAGALAGTPVVFPEQGVVACQGVEGAYGQQACEKLFALPEIVYCRSFEAVFQAVESGLCQFGVMPIENSSFGSVGAVYDLMLKHRFHIVRSTKLAIDHKLLGRSGASLSGIREIFSHEQAIGQCSAFLAAHPEIKVTACENTAIAAQKVAESGRDDVAAIASVNCAALYGLSVLAEDIQNNANNQTRFICIARDLAVYPGADRISLMLATPHRPGELYRVIARFAALGLNITKLESRPVPGSDFSFLFYLDIEASVQVPEVSALLGELSQGDALFTFLGAYREV